MGSLVFARVSSRALLLAFVVLAVLAGTARPALANDPTITSFTAFVPTPSPPVPTERYAFALDATYSPSMPGWVRGSIFEETGGSERLLTSGCWYSSCVVNVAADAPADLSNPPDRVFRLSLYSSGVEYETQTLVVHERELHFSVSLDFSSSPGWAVAHTSPNMGGSGLSTVIRNGSGTAVHSCDVYWSTCNAAASVGTSYRATVEDAAGHIFGASSTWTVTSSGATEQTADGIDLVSLAALFSTDTDVCNALLTYPGTHLEGSSASDQWLACDAAASSGSSLPDLLRAVAAAGAGGTGVLWWLAHQGSVSTLPPPPLGWPDSAAPTAPLPTVWPVGDLADAYMLQSGDLSQSQAATIAASCLWLAARANANGRTDCASLPIFVSGSDVAEATQHDLDAIADDPAWALLNYEAGGTKANRDWYKTQPDCEVDHDPSQQCDEFPFFATEQGGPLAVPTPSLRYINGTDNVTQGGQYGGFVTSCGLTTGTPQESGNAIGGSPFIMIPLPPSLGIPSTRLCNSP